MALQYPQQSFFPYGQPQWPEDVKPALSEDDASSILDDRVFESSTPTDMTELSDARRASVRKVEDDYSASGHLWQERSHGGMGPTRQYSQSSIPSSLHHPQFYDHINTTNCAPAYMQHQAWPLSARSEASTPTPFYGPVQEPFDHPVQYPAGPVSFNFAQPEPLSAVSMSPQSSQGGCASTTSSDVAETSSSIRHRFKLAASSQLVARSDGIRKKNAKFEIPHERNLNTIEALISRAENDDERKELKQQKRLLRNRQAAYVHRPVFWRSIDRYLGLTHDFARSKTPRNSRWRRTPSLARSKLSKRPSLTFRTLSNKNNSKECTSTKNSKHTSNNSPTNGTKLFGPRRLRPPTFGERTISYKTPSATWNDN
jgi:hypothetical protein